MKLILASLFAVVTSFAPAAWAQQPSGEPLIIGFEGPASISTVPMLMTADRLREKGFKVEVVEFQSPETMSLALQAGEIHLGSTNAGTVFSAIDAGFDGIAFMGSAAADFLMVARTGLDTCADLDGRAVAIQSTVSTTGALTTRWLAEECPEAKPNVLVVPGSENRVAGLIAGQLDASAVDTQNTTQLLKQRPGEFGTIDSFAESADLVGSLYYGSADWLAKNQELVRAFVANYIDIVNETYADPSAVKERLHKLLEGTDPAILDQVVDSWVERRIYIPVEGVQPERIEDALKVYGASRTYKKISNASDVATTAYLPTK
jgi:ABC-type nitrate/sulfonate/bicarbonate transport system substrate-binding protein